MNSFSDYSFQQKKIFTILKNKHTPSEFTEAYDNIRVFMWQSDKIILLHTEQFLYKKTDQLQGYHKQKQCPVLWR